ncbi:MAG: hypothetical protein IJW48_01560 [Clostridia bacterium]|nr:hypothetical protein [Clostridia bacterium]
MIRLVICKNGDGGAAVPPDFPFLRELVSKTGSNRLKSERISAYLALKYSYEKLFLHTFPTITKDEKERPCFTRPNEFVSDFSISHTSGISVIAFLSGEGRVGVDAELEYSSEKLDGISNKFFKKANFDLQRRELCVEIMIAELYNDSVKFIDTLPIVTNKIDSTILFSSSDTELSYVRLGDFDFFDRWTSLEALLKADGGGFSSLSLINELLPESLSLGLRMSVGNDVYRISLCHLKQALTDKNGAADCDKY